MIDTICARFTDEYLYELIKARLKQGPFVTEDLVPFIQAKDRSLDTESAKRLAETALQDLLQGGILKVEGESFLPAKTGSDEI